MNCAKVISDPTHIIKNKNEGSAHSQERISTKLPQPKHCHLGAVNTFLDYVSLRLLSYKLSWRLRSGGKAVVKVT